MLLDSSSWIWYYNEPVQKPALVTGIGTVAYATVLLHCFRFLLVPQFLDAKSNCTHHWRSYSHPSYVCYSNLGHFSGSFPLHPPRMHFGGPIPLIVLIAHHIICLESQRWITTNLDKYIFAHNNNKGYVPHLKMKEKDSHIPKAQSGVD